MTLENVRKVSRNSLQKSIRKSPPSPTRFHIIKCVCGSEILIVPDLKAMSKAIHNHLMEHTRAEKDVTKAAAQWAVAENFLIEQLFALGATVEIESIPCFGKANSWRA